MKRSIAGTAKETIKCGREAGRGRYIPISKAKGRKKAIVQKITVYRVTSGKKRGQFARKPKG